MPNALHICIENQHLPYLFRNVTFYRYLVHVASEPARSTNMVVDIYESHVFLMYINVVTKNNQIECIFL